MNKQHLPEVTGSSKDEYASLKTRKTKPAMRTADVLETPPTPKLNLSQEADEQRPGPGPEFSSGSFSLSGFPSGSQGRCDLGASAHGPDQSALNRPHLARRSPSQPAMLICADYGKLLQRDRSGGLTTCVQM